MSIYQKPEKSNKISRGHSLCQVIDSFKVLNIKFIQPLAEKHLAVKTRTWPMLNLPETKKNKKKDIRIQSNKLKDKRDFK